MTHLGTVPLETERLILRPFRLDDAEAMYQNWASDPEVTKTLMWPTHESVETSRAVLADWVGRYGEKDYYQWAIVPKNGGDRPAGSIAVVRQDDTLRMVHIGYCLGRSWWGQGVMTEALAALRRFFFCEVGVNRVESRHGTHNPASGRVMQKCGMTREGTHRQADWDNQGVCDCTYYAILAEDYLG